MLNSRKTRLALLEKKAEVPNEFQKAIKHYLGKIDLNKNILPQLTGVEPVIVNHIIKTAGNYRDEEYQALQQKQPKDCSNDELLYLIQGSVKNLLECEYEYIQAYATSVHNEISQLTDTELIKVIVGERPLRSTGHSEV